MVVQHTEAFSQQQPLLFSIAYRMLGSVAEAEDIVQETFLRWQQTEGEDVRSPKSYLSTIATRLCIDQLRSARAQREEYIGPWLPEPLTTEHIPPMDDKLALADSLSMAFLLLLETLAPTERAVFLLREVFDYDYAEIANIVEKSESNCRQISRRARQRVADRQPRFDVASEEVARMMERFLHAATTGDMNGLLSLLADDATLWSDGGGKVVAAVNPIRGADNITRFFLGLLKKAPPGFAVRLASINEQPGIITYVNGRPQSAGTFDVIDGKIHAVRVVVNPDKLRHVPPLKP